MAAGAFELSQREAREQSSDVTRAIVEERKWLVLFGVPAHVVEVGEQLEDFTIPDAAGRRVSLSGLAADGPVVLVFYRGSWCPYCHLALETYQAELVPQLARFGATMAAISPQPPNPSLSLVERHALAFPVLTDAGAYVARMLGIVFRPTRRVLDVHARRGVDIAVWNDAASAELPMPTVLIVDPSLTVRFVDIRPDYARRTEVADIVAALEALT